MDAPLDSAAPLSPPQAQATVNMPPSMGLDGLWAKIANFSAVVILAGIAVWGFMIVKDELKNSRTDMKESHRDSREAAKEAHKAFLDDAERTRAQMQKQWDEVRKQGELNNKAIQLGTELQKDIRDHQKMLEANQRANADLVIEIKKTMADATAVNKEILLELKKSNKEKP